jgi:hypothetical protein
MCCKAEAAKDRLRTVVATANCDAFAIEVIAYLFRSEAIHHE